MGAVPVAEGIDHVPIIDVRALVDPSLSAAARLAVATQIGAACRDSGFFYIVEAVVIGWSCCNQVDAVVTRVAAIR